MYNKKNIFLIGILLLVVAISFFYLNRNQPQPENTTEIEKVLVDTSEENTENKQISELYDKCINEFTANQYQRVLCLFPYFKLLAKEEGVLVAIERAKELKATGEINDCHLPSHMIGEVNLEISNYDLGKAFSNCPLGCFEGCFHGAFEAYSDHVGGIENLVTAGDLPEICKTVGTDRKLKLQCVHGIGHALMRHHKTSELLGKIDICKRITDIDYQTGCVDGVFMENVNNYLELSESKLRESLPKICEPIEKSDKYKDLLWLCAQEISGGLIAYTGDNLVLAESICQSLSGELEDRCIAGLTESRKTFSDTPHDAN